jgi:CysZ protein
MAVGFVDGLIAPIRGLRWLASTPRTWPLAAVPVLALVGIFATVGTGFGFAFRDALLPRLRAAIDAPILVALAGLVVAIALLIFATLIALTLAQPLSGPALDRLCELHAHGLGAAPPAKTPFHVGLARSLRVTLVGLAFGLPAIALLSLVGLLVPPAAIVTVPAKVAIGALLLAWDLLDYPLSMRGSGVRARFAWISRNKGAVLGLGLASVALGFVPCAGLLFLPAGVVGATGLVISSARQGD